MNVLALAMVLCPRAATACTCFPPPEPHAAMLDAAAVFAGEVVDLRLLEDYSTEVTFRVSRIWKGKNLAMLTVADGANCGFGFETGKRYLVYAYGFEGRLGTGMCTRTEPLETNDDLGILPYSIHPFAGPDPGPEPELDAIPAEHLAQRLGSTDPRLRLQAIWSLPARPEVVETAANALDDVLRAAPDLERRHLLAALEQLPAGRAEPLVTALAGNLADGNAEIRLGAVGALAALGPEALPALDALIFVVEDDDFRLRLRQVLDRTPGSDPELVHHRRRLELAERLPTAAAGTLGAVGPEASSAGAAILAGLRAGRLQPAAAAALPALGSQVAEALDYFRGELRAPTPRRRWIGAEGLAALGPAAAAAAGDLVTLLEDPKPWVRADAARAVAAVGAPEMPRLLGLLASDDFELDSGLADAFEIYARRGEDVVEPLATAILEGRVSDSTLLALRGKSYAAALGARLEAAGLASGLQPSTPRESGISRFFDRFWRYCEPDQFPHDQLLIGLALVLVLVWVALREWGEQGGRLRRSAVQALPLLMLGMVLWALVIDGGAVTLRHTRQFFNRFAPPEQQAQAGRIRRGSGYLAILNPGTENSAEPFWRSSLTSVAAGGGRILAGDRQASAFVFDAETGSRSLTLHDPAPDGDFGSEVAIAGDTLIVAAPHRGDAAVDAGAVFLFDAGSGELRRRLDPPRVRADARFGSRLAADGEHFAVAAPRDDTKSEHGGTIHLYRSDGELVRSFDNPAPELCRGLGDTALLLLPAGGLAAGTPSCNGYGVDGLVFVFDRASGEVVLRLGNPRPGDLDLFGGSLAAVGDDILVGAPQDGPATRSDGAVYLFDGTTGALLLDLPNPEPDAEGSSHFGSSVVSLGGDRFAVGAPGNDAVYVFASASGKRLETIRWPHVLVSKPRASQGGFGDRMAVLDRSLLVLASREQGFVGDRSGVLYVFPDTR